MRNERNAGVPAGPSQPVADGDVGVPRPEWYSRGYLPHRDRKGLVQAVTFRLADSLPQEKLAQLEEELKCLPEDRRSAERRVRIEQWLDSGMGCCALGHPAVARTVQESLLHFDGERYRLLAWCVMPNHVHVLVEPLIALATIVQGWKSFTSRWALARNDKLRLGIPGAHQFWMREYFDRYMRDEEHLRRSVEYIHNNPVKAALCKRAQDWRWSSAWNADVLVGHEKKEAGGDAGVPGGTPTSASANQEKAAGGDAGVPYD